MAPVSAPLPSRGDDGVGVVVRRQPWFRWDASGLGVLVPEVVCGLSVREVVAVASADQFDAPTQSELTAFLRQAATGVLAGAVGWSPGAALELRYVSEPRLAGLTQVRLFVTGKAI